MDSRQYLSFERSFLQTAGLILFLAVVLASSPFCALGQLPQIPALNWQPRSDWLNVRSFGAAGDGVADDTAAVQAVLDRVSDRGADGAVVYFPPGDYRITRTLTLTGPLLGILVIGHGRDTTLIWDGADDGHLFSDNGVAYSRFVGLSFEGQNRAAVGFYHFSTNRFETEVRHQHLAFRNFTQAGVWVVPQPVDDFSLAETTFENCLFENCDRGLSFVSFNDYNYTIDGCEFRQCGTGIYCSHGNFYARNTHFEGSTVADIQSYPEHACSVRRCTSQGSNRFLIFSNSVSPMTVEDCHVDGWTAADGAIRLSGAPFTLFDCVFTNPPNTSPPVIATWHLQRMIVSENSAPGSTGVIQAPAGAQHIHQIPAGERKGSIQSSSQRFLKDTAPVPGAVFDAKVDFGAAGDGVADDTLAIQNCIDAARTHGNGAIAYIPTGDYWIDETLQIHGSNYYVGGSGFQARLKWRGAADGTMVKVEDPDNLTLEHIIIGGDGASHNDIDILQTDSGTATRMTYDGVYVFGQYEKDPSRKGLVLSGLGRRAVVDMQAFTGNIRVLDCARAMIVGSTTYEGAITVEGTGPERDGLLGFMTRLSTLNKYGLYLRDNHSITMSDFYVESADSGFAFEGSPALPPGRATIQGAKQNFRASPGDPTAGIAVNINDYAGRIFIGHHQLYNQPVDVRIVQKGTSPVELFLHSSLFYVTRRVLDVGPSFSLRMLNNMVVGDPPGDPSYEPADIEPAIAAAALPEALDDLRRLGQADLVINHLGLDADSDGDGDTNYEEILAGTDPFDSGSPPAAPQDDDISGTPVDPTTSGEPGMEFAEAAAPSGNPPVPYDGGSETGTLNSGGWDYYEVVVPANSEGIKVTLSSVGAGDADLYLRLNDDPTTSAYTLRSIDSAFDALFLTSTAAQDRTYQVGVYLPGSETGPADYTLETHGEFIESTLAWDDGSQPEGTAPFAMTAVQAGPYYFKITTNAPPLDVWRTVVKVTGGEADLYAGWGFVPATFSYTQKSENTGSDGFTRRLSSVSGAGQEWYFLVEASAGSQFEIFAGDIHVQNLGALAADASSGSGAVSIPIEGARFFRTSIPPQTLGWRLWLQNAAGTGTWNHDFYIRKGLAPHTSSYDKKPNGQELLVPGYIDPGGGDLYYVGVWGTNGETFQLDSRQQAVTDIPFCCATPVSLAGGFRFETFRVEVPVGRIAWEVTVTPATGDPNVAVRRGKVPAPFENDAFSEIADPAVADSVCLVPPELSDGSWYITVYSDADYSADVSNSEPVITPIDYATANYDPLNPQNSFFQIINDDTARAGWRYYVVPDTGAPQLGSLGWLLELENQVPDSEIAIRRNFLPERRRFRQNGAATILETCEHDASSTLGFLQHLDHESDIWYVGVYTPDAALGAFTLKSGHVAARHEVIDGGGDTVTNLTPERWEFVRIVVPDRIAGEDVLGWQFRVDSWSGSAPAMVVRRGRVPTGVFTSRDMWGGAAVPYEGGTRWDSGAQWKSGFADWTGRPSSADGSQSNESYGMWAAMGQPLEPGTYYVGFYNDSETAGSSFSFSSKAVGVGMSIVPQALAYNGGMANVNALPAREVAYYSVDIPAGTPGWRVSLSADAGESGLYLKQTTIPTTQTASNPYFPPFDDTLVRLRKEGDEHYTLLPRAGESELPAGRYYLMVVSEGLNPASSGRIGTGTSSATLTSHGAAEPATDLGMPAIGSDIVHNDSYAPGRLKHYTFTVPASVTVIELSMENRVGNPWMSARHDPGDANFPSNGFYGYYSGYGGNGVSDGIITRISPPAGGVWRVTVMDRTFNPGNLAAGSYTLRIRAFGELPLSFDGGSHTVPNLGPKRWEFFQVVVPGQIAGEDVLGWQLRMDSWSGAAPAMVVRRDVPPTNTVTDRFRWGGPRYPYEGGTQWDSGAQWKSGVVDWTGRSASEDGSQSNESYGMWVAMGQPLEPGTYYVGFYNDSETANSSFSFSSKAVGVGMSIVPQALAYNGGVANVNALPAREVAYYSVDLPAGTPGWRVSLSADAGESGLYLKQTTIPTSQTHSNPYFPPFDETLVRLRKEGDEHYTLLPKAGESELPAGRYYLMVVSEGLNPASPGRIGTGTSSATLTSHGAAEPATDLGMPAIGSDIVHNDSYAPGRLKHHTFTVPAGIDSIALSMENRVGNPRMFVRYDQGDANFPAGAWYGYSSGYGAEGVSNQIISLHNPPGGSVWRVTVMDSSPDPGNLAAGSYTLRIRALGEVPLSFDGGSVSVSGQSPRTWRLFRVEVPSQIGGETVRGWQLRVDSWSGAAPSIVVRRDAMPADSPTSEFLWGGPRYPYEGGTQWDSGAQWVNGFGNWTGRLFSADGSQYNESYGMWAAMGQPLEPGTYYVGLYNGSVASDSSFSFSSKAVGEGMSIVPQALTYNGGVANVNALPAREVAYYYVDIAPGTPSWRVSFGADIGESALYIKQSTIPTSQTASASNVSPFDDALVRLQKDGDEHYTLLPKSNESALPAGRYYLMVVSEGMNPVKVRIGTESSSATLASHGAAPVHDLGVLSIGGQLSLPDTYGVGRLSLIQFEVPTGSPAVEVKLEDRVGKPEFTLSWSNPQFPSAGLYGYSSGGSWNRRGTRTTIANATPGTYRLAVLDPAPATSFASGSYTLGVRSLAPLPLNFSATQNGNGLSNSAGGVLGNDERAYHEVQVPLELGGQPVIGWRLEVEALAGQPEIRVRKSALPAGTVASGESLTNWTRNSVIIVPPELQPGTWYVEVRGVGSTEYALTSEAVLLERSPWIMPGPGELSSTPGVAAPYFGDTGVDASGAPLAGDQGVDLENGHYHFYAIDVSYGNGGLLRAQLQAISGDPDLYVRHEGVPSMDHTSPPAGPARYVLYDYRLDAASRTEFGSFVPIDGRVETQLAPGRWYLAVRAGGNTHARYRLTLAVGPVNDLALDGGLAGNQLLAAGDWRYYRVVIPEEAPTVWTVSWSHQQGDVDLYVRDTIPPGDSFLKGSNGSALPDIRDWQDDDKTSALETGYPDAGSYAFSPPLLRPGSIYYLGFRANSDAVFDVASSVSGGTIGVIPEIAFEGGFIDITIPAGEHRNYKVVVPTNAIRWVHSSVRTGAVELRIEQGAPPSLTGGVHYSDTVVNGSLDRALTGWPWVPGKTYYITFIDNGAAAEPLQFTMMGDTVTYAYWAGLNGLPTDPALAPLDGNANGIAELFEYALVSRDGIPVWAMPQVATNAAGDRVGIEFILPADVRRDATLVIEASADLQPLSWSSIASKAGDDPWSGPATIEQMTLADGSVLVKVLDVTSIFEADRSYLRLKAILSY